MKSIKIKRLEAGESVVTSEYGNSMIPLIKSGQKHKLDPIKLEDVLKDDIVFCKVKGCLYTHLVLATDKRKGLLIGNNRGGINGWTKIVYGKVVEVY